jgi:hypothetical protein
MTLLLSPLEIQIELPEYPEEDSLVNEIERTFV